jgi:hypothetical protein
VFLRAPRLRLQLWRSAVRRGAAQRSVPVEVLDGRVRAGAEQRGCCGDVAIAGSIVQRRVSAGNGGTGVGTGHPAAPPQKAHLMMLFWMFSDAPAFMSAWTDRRSP